MQFYSYKILLFAYGVGAGISASILFYQFFIKKKRRDKLNTSSQSGNIFFTLFGAVALVGVVGAGSMTIMKGPVRVMAEVTKRTIAENNMIASGKLSLIAAVANQPDSGDCDLDGHVEPIQFVVATPSPTGGGQLPTNLGASLQDPWKTNYGYCVWDHGTFTADTGANCIAPGGANNRLAGENTDTGVTLAIISAGPDRTFQTSCNAYPTANAVNKPAGSDDLVLKYSYAEATAGGGGLWNIKSGSPETAEIQKNLEIRDSGGIVTFSLDKETGIGEFLAVKTDSLYSKTPGAPVTMGSLLRAQNVTGLAAPTGGAGGGGSADNLGDHIATQILNMSSNKIINLTNPTAAQDATTKAYVDAQGGADNLGNHTATQILNMNSNKITNLTDPAGAQDAATKAYVDASGGGAPTCTTRKQSRVGQANVTVSCQAGETVTGGGCTGSGLATTIPVTVPPRTWQCGKSGSTGTITAYVICCTF